MKLREIFAYDFRVVNNYAGNGQYSGTLFSYLLIFLEPRRDKGVVLKSYKSVSSVSSVFENYSGMEMETSHLCVWHFRESDIIKPVFSDPMAGQNNLYVMDFILYWECFLHMEGMGDCCTL